MAKEDESLKCRLYICLLYTSDAADERSSVDLGGRRIIKKNNKKKNKRNPPTPTGKHHLSVRMYNTIDECTASIVRSYTQCNISIYNTYEKKTT